MAAPKINIAQYIKILLKNFWVILIFVIIGCLLGTYETKATPVKYKSSVSLYVYLPPSHMDASVKIYLSSRLRSDYIEFLKTDWLKEKVVASAENKISLEDIDEGLEIEIATSKRFFTIHFLHENPEVSMEIANLFADTLLENEADVLGTEYLSIIKYAELPQAPVNRDLLTNVEMGIVIGTVLGLVVMQIKIVNQKRVTKCESILELEVLGIIPVTD